MLKNLKLGTKFTLLMALVLLGGILISYISFSQVLEQRAQDQVTSEGLILLALMNSVCDYTSTHVNPLLADRLASDPKFDSESVPAFSARTVASSFHGLPEYNSVSYKEAAPNPMNPLNQADAFETNLVDQFKANPELHEISGYRDVNGTRLFYNARPMQVKSASCLACHSTADAAPKSLIATYGPNGGFGWKLSEIIATQIIYVPAGDVSSIAGLSVTLVMGIFVIIFAIAVFAINFLLRRNVIQPIGQVASLAQIITAGTLSPKQEEINRLDGLAKRGDELGQLGQIFQKMAREVHEREERLKQQVYELRIEIDETRKAQQVAEITETDYFQKLKERAQELRNRTTE